VHRRESGHREEAGSFVQGNRDGVDGGAGEENLLNCSMRGLGYVGVGCGVSETFFKNTDSDSFERLINWFKMSSNFDSILRTPVEHILGLLLIYPISASDNF
jgi:hypothetical protein